MALLLATFEANLATVVNESTTDIPGLITTKVRQAVQFLERNFTLKYMEEAEVHTLASANRRSTFITDRMKELKFIEVHDPDTGKIVSLIKQFSLTELTVKDLTGGLDEKGPPTQADLAGITPHPLGGDDRVINIDLYPLAEKDYDLTLKFFAFSVWPPPNNFHWLLDYAEDLLEAQTILMLGPALRDQELLALAKLTRGEALRTLHISKFAQEESLHGDSAFKYVGEN